MLKIEYWLIKKLIGRWLDRMGTFGELGKALSRVYDSADNKLDE